MYVTWIEILELGLLPVGLVLGYVGGRTCGRDERESFDSHPAAYPGLAPEYPRRGDPIRHFVGSEFTRAPVARGERR